PCATIAYTVTNGLGGYSTTPTLNGYPATFQCPFTSTGALSGSYACSSPTGVTAVGTPANDAVSVTASDTANASTPSANATSGTATLPVSPLLSFTPPSTVNPAVTGRAYGTGSGCSGGGGACQPLAYGIANGTTVFAASATMATSAGAFSCSLSGAIYNCSSAGITGAVSPATLGISVSDVANASTPSGSASDSSKTLTIDAPLTLSLTSGAPAPSVVGRAYGSGGGCSGGNCTPITYSISGGLGGYTNPVTLTGAPQAISALICSLSGSTYTCSAGSLGPASLGSQTDDTLTATVSDTANVSTPASSVTNTSASLTLDPAMTIAPATGQGTPTNAVVNAAYGSGAGCSGGNCAPIKYTVAGGLGNYAGAATLTESPTALTGFACPISGTTYSCSASPLGPSLSSQATDTLSVTTSETGNASTPGATTPANTSLSVTVNPPLATSLTPSPLSNGPAVTNRSYGVGATCGSGETSACAPLVFTATGGTVESSASNYAYLVNPATALSAAGFNSCTAGGANGANYTCTAASVSAISAVDLSKVSVDDASNASTPASKPVELASSLTVNAPLSIPSSPVPPNALLGYQYALSPSFFTLAAQSGLSSNGIASWSVYAPAAPASPCPANTPGVLNGLSLDTTTGVISGTAITTGVVNFDSCGTDVANGSTPKGTGASAHPPDYSFTVVNPYAYVIDSGATAVDVIDTGAGSGAPSNPSVSVTGLTLTSPLGIAVTQDSLEAVAIVSTNEIAVIDTTTNLAAAKSPFSLASGNTCTTAKGIAIFGTTGYLLCDNGSSQSDVYVLPLAGLTVAGSSTITPTGSPIHLGTSVAPTAIAVSSDGSTLVVAEATATPALQIIQTSNGTLSPPTSLTLGTIPVAAVTAVNAPNIDAYVAETEAGSPGQVDVVSIDTTTFAGSLQSPVTFNKIGSTDPEPTCIAVTPDAARVYVGLSQTDQISVFTNSSNPGGLATAYSFPGLAAGAGTLAPAGVAIPPLNPALSPGDFRVFFTTTGASKGDVYYFDDNGGAPSGGSALILSLGSTSTPEGIAAIPVPTLP
ncbi:MAG: beta strand repeat-containing protein, partial [Terriglobia bacterium]